MGLFAGDNLTIKTDILEGSGTSAILKITFAGVHDHHWPHGEKINSFVKDEAINSNCAACLFDFLGYHYEYGNEIGGLIMVACIDAESQALRDFAIVSEGNTARILKSLFADMNVSTVFSYDFFDNVDKGLAFLRGQLAGNEPSHPAET